MQRCGRWWGRLAARGAPRHLRPAGGPPRQQQRWGGGEAARCIEQLLPRHDDFCRRHIGPREREKREMLRAVGVQSVEELMDKTIPASIRLRRPLRMDDHVACCHGVENPRLRVTTGPESSGSDWGTGEQRQRGAPRRLLRHRAVQRAAVQNCGGLVNPQILTL